MHRNRGHECCLTWAWKRTKRSMPRTLSTLLAILWITVTVAGLVQAQTAPTSSQSEEEKLEQDFTDPLTTLPR